MTIVLAYYGMAAPGAVPTRLAKPASERFREIAVIKSRTNRFIWPAAVEGTKSLFVQFKTKDDLLNPEPNFRSPIWFGVKQVGTALDASHRRELAARIALMPGCDVGTHT